MKTVAVRAVFKDGRKPVYSSPLAAGADLFADLDESIVLESLERRLIPTGVFLEIPEGYEAQVRPRSGLAIKHGLSLVNTPGTIDADYRGEIKVIAVNLGKDYFGKIRSGHFTTGPIQQINEKRIKVW